MVRGNLGGSKKWNSQLGNSNGRDGHSSDIDSGLDIPSGDITGQSLSQPTPATGLVNHGCTCYINAMQQWLANTDQLAEYLVTGRFIGDIQSDVQMSQSSGGLLTFALADLLRALWFDQYTPEMSQWFKVLIGTLDRCYKSDRQQDAQEFLTWLQDNVHQWKNAPSRSMKKGNMFPCSRRQKTRNKA